MKVPGQRLLQVPGTTLEAAEKLKGLTVWE